MRFRTPEFEAYNVAGTKQPQWVVSIEAAEDDVIYFTSDAATPTPEGGTVLAGMLLGISGTLQRIQPEQGNSTIGNLRIRLLDKNGAVTQAIASRDAAGVGIRHKRLRVYMGFRGMTWESMESNLVQTQIIDDLRFNEGVYTLACADVNRSIRNDIFDLAKTTLSNSITADSQYIPVYSADNFELLQHGNSYTEAPNRKVLYIKIEDEVIRCSGITHHPQLGLSFVVDTYTNAQGQTISGRGALNTVAAAHHVDSSASEDQRTEVTEFVYLEMPAVKLVYAILTGTLYGQPGERLPNGWHLDIPPEYVRTADFLNIGDDLWDPENDDAGLIVRFAGEKKQDAKKFIEQQICLLLGAYMPIYSNGEIGIKRMTSILADAPHVFELNETNVTRYHELTYDYKSVHNVLNILWNYDHVRDILTRQRLLIDNTSRSKYKDAPAKTLKFTGLHGSRHTPAMINSLFNRLRDRYAAPPLRISVQVLPMLNHLEVGDIVRLNLPGLKDAYRGGPLNRAFEIQQVRVDWVTGAVTLELFGSGQPASVIPDGNEDDNYSLPDSYYTKGTPLSSVLTIENVGGVGHVIASGHLSGGQTLTQGMYYYDGDLQINDGVTITFDLNVQLRIKGHLQINGTLNGTGRGYPGGAAQPDWPDAYEDTSAFRRVNPGQAGYIGPSISGGGVYFGHDNRANRLPVTSYSGHYISGQASQIPSINLTVENGDLIGLPNVLAGCSGSSGHNSMSRAVAGLYNFGSGGAGGASGAGLCVVARGVTFGVNGRLISNGTNGSVGRLVRYDGGIENAYGGSGAGGAPGATLFVIDGLNSEIPNLNHVTAEYGVTPIPGDAVVMSGPSVGHPKSFPLLYSYYTGYAGASRPILSGYNGGSRVLFVPPTDQKPEEDTPPIAPLPTSVHVHEIINYPRTAEGTQVTLEVWVTRPVPLQGYGWSNIYYRRKGSTAWISAGVADDETAITLTGDGTTYEIQARSVSAVSRQESPSGPVIEITTTNLVNPDNIGDIEKAMPVHRVTGLQLVNKAESTDNVFTGKDVHLTWRQNSADRPEIGHEPITQGMGAGNVDPWYKDTEIRVYTRDMRLLRTEYSDNFSFTYTEAMNLADSAALGLTGLRSTLVFQLRNRGTQHQMSKRITRLVVVNPTINE